MMKSLDSGRLDGFVENEAVLMHLAAQKKERFRWKKSSPDVSSDPRLYIAFSPANKHADEWADLFSKELLKLRKTGELQKILDKYQVKDWEKASSLL